MKKLLLSIALILSFSVVAVAQQKLYGFQADEQQKPVPKIGADTHNGNFFSSSIDSQDGIFAGSNVSKNTLTPDFEYIGNWNYWVDIETGEITYYECVTNLSGNNRNLEFSLLNDDFEVTSTFSIDVDNTTNTISVLQRRTSSYFIVYVHHFEGAGGPANQVHRILLIDNEGNVIENYRDRTAVTFFKDNLVIVNFDDYNTDYVIYFHDLETIEEKFSITFESTLTYNIGGAVCFASEVDGEEYFVVQHYESLFMNNQTLEITPNNKLLVRVYDGEFNIAKSLDLELDQFLQTGAIAIPTFGNFHPDFNVTKNIFSNDDKWAFAIPFSITSFMHGDNNKYYVIDEDGDIIKSYDHNSISGSMRLSDIEGFDKQIAFVVNGIQGEEIRFFNIESWAEEPTVFGATHNGDNLSFVLNRIKNGDDFNYIISLGNTDVVDGKPYCVIKIYDRNAEELSKVTLPMEVGAQAYSPILERELLNPHLFDTDIDMEYVYTYRISGLVNFAISKSGASEPLMHQATDPVYSSPSSSGFIYDGGVPKYLFNIYSHFSAPNTLTRFYSLPLISHNIEEVTLQVATNNPNENAEGALVKLANAAMFKSYETEVNNNGEAIFENVEAGSYSVSITKSAYYDFDTDITATEDDTEFGVFQILMYNPPVNLIFEAENTTVTLSWTAPEVFTPLAIRGYNIYRDGIKINDGIVIETEYTEDLPDGDYTYYVTAVMSNDIESAKSNEVSVNISTVGIRKNSISTINAYPNPTTDKIVIENTNNFSSVRIFDITGKLLKENVNIDNVRVEIDFSLFENGIYIVNVDGEIVKVVKR